MSLTTINATNTKSVIQMIMKTALLGCTVYRQVPINRLSWDFAGTGKSNIPVIWASFFTYVYNITIQHIYSVYPSGHCVDSPGGR